MKKTFPVKKDHSILYCIHVKENDIGHLIGFDPSIEVSNGGEIILADGIIICTSCLLEYENKMKEIPIGDLIVYEEDSYLAISTTQN